MRTTALFTLLLMMTGCAIGVERNELTRIRLDRAKEEFASSVTEAKDRLLHSFDVAIEDYARHGNLDGALAVRQQRDEFAATHTVTGDPQPRIENGWTILFESDNPLLWNVPIHNSSSYAIPIDFAPHDTRYVRLRRMDTGEMVIAKCTRDEIDGAQRSSGVVFRGDKRINRQACSLGLQDYRRSVGLRNQPILAVRPEGNFTGWGFGEVFGEAERQGYVWNGRELGRTAIQIAVTSRDLTAAEKRLLLVE